MRIKVLGLVLRPAEGARFPYQQMIENLCACSDKLKPYADSHSKLHGNKTKFSFNNDRLYQGSLLRRGLKQRLRDYSGYLVTSDTPDTLCIVLL